MGDKVKPYISKLNFDDFLLFFDVDAFFLHFGFEYFHFAFLI